MSPLQSFFLVVFAVAGLGLGTAAADPIPFPDEFIGIWENAIVMRDCVTQIILFESTEPDTICAGDTFDPSFGETPLTCTGTITPEAVDIHCEGSYVVDPECTANVQFDMTGTRSGETWTSTTRIETTFVGTSCPVPSSCVSIESTGTRTNPDPGECPPAPVAPVSWGWLKHLYD